MDITTKAAVAKAAETRKTLTAAVLALVDALGAARAAHQAVSDAARSRLKELPPRSRTDAVGTYGRALSPWEQAQPCVAGLIERAFEGAKQDPAAALSELDQYIGRGYARLPAMFEQVAQAEAVYAEEQAERAAEDARLAPARTLLSQLAELAEVQGSAGDMPADVRAAIGAKVLR